MNLKQFILELQQTEQLLEVDIEVDSRLEMAALTDYVCKKEGPGLLFTRVKDSGIALATNLFGSDRRMARALGHDSLASFRRWVSAELASLPGENSSSRLASLPPRYEKLPPATERGIHATSLDFLPAIRYWAEERRSFLTLAVVVSRAPEAALQNYGLYRVGVAGLNKLTLNLLPGSGAGAHLDSWRAKGERMPVALLLGADPALIFAAAASLPDSCSETSFCAALRRSSFQSSRCQTLPLSCPTSAQIVIEGWIDHRQILNEGPFGCFTGYYGGSNDCPVMEVSAVSMVEQPLLPLTLAGPLPMEDCWIAQANLALISARLELDIPEIRTIEMPLEAAFHGLYFVRCHDSALRIEELIRQIQRLDYLKGVKQLILLHDEDETPAQSNWRELLQRVAPARVWHDPGIRASIFSKNNEAKLQHDPQILADLLLRLQASGLTL